MGITPDQLAADAKPRTEVAKICVDGELFSQVQELHRQLVAERQSDDGDVGGSGKAREIEQLLEQAHERTWCFRLRALGTDRWKRLKDEHPPTKQQVKDATDRKERPPEVRDSFWPAAIAACLDAVKKESDGDDAWQQVDWDEDDVAEFTAEWNAAQFAELQASCRLANESGSALPGKDSAFARMLNGDGRSGPQGRSAGLDRSSTGGG